MSRLIDVEKLKDAIIVVSKMYGNSHEVEEVKKLLVELLDRCPTVDAVPVVRCKECIYFEAKNNLETQGVCMCGEKEMNYGGEFYPFADDFCSYGERKEEKE